MTAGSERRLSDTDFRALVEDAKARHNLSDVIGRRTKLKRRGAREMVGLCPFHTEKSPSFEVNDAKGTYYCHGCAASGDHMTFLMKADGMTFAQAFQALTGDTFPIVSEAERAQRKREAAEATAKRIRMGRRVWFGAAPAAGTLAETYLRARGIIMPIPDTVRFAPLDYYDQDTGNVIARAVPAVVCALQDANGDVVGVQRIYLSADGRAKFDVPKPKMSLGIIVGSAFRARGHDMTGATGAIVCEGPENGLTLAQEIDGDPVMVACGASLLPRLEFPASVRHVMLAGDNDDAGRAAIAGAETAYGLKGLTSAGMFPAADFKDWNDQLRGIRV